MEEENAPRATWRTAVVTTIHRGGDGEVRSATVRTAEGNLLTRPINLLYPLEITEEEMNEGGRRSPTPSDSLKEVGDPNLERESAYSTQILTSKGKCPEQKGERTPSISITETSRLKTMNKSKIPFVLFLTLLCCLSSVTALI